MNVFDARGMECPLPVVKTKQKLDEMENNEILKVLVDNEIAVQNLKKFAKVRNYQTSDGKDGNDYFVNICKGNSIAEIDEDECYETCARGNDIVVFDSNVMGSNKELGDVLMKSFIFALTKQDRLPRQMIFYNEGILLTCSEGDILNDLKELENNGVEIVSCGTCLDFFNKKDDLGVGSITNMYDFVERMEKASKIIRP